MSRLEELNEKLEEIRKAMWVINTKKYEENRALEFKRIEPINDQIRKIRNEIEKQMIGKYSPVISQINKEREEIQAEIDALNIEQSKSLWHPAGTIVKCRKRVKGSGYWASNFEDVTGVVQVYDGTQDLEKRLASATDKGTIIVVFLKKDGTMGKRFDFMFINGHPTHRYNNDWLADGETPENNLLDKLRKKAENE